MPPEVLVPASHCQWGLSLSLAEPQFPHMKNDCGGCQQTEGAAYLNGLECLDSIYILSRLLWGKKQKTKTTLQSHSDTPTTQY